MSANKVLITTSSFGAKDKASLDALRDAGCTAVLNPFGRTLTEAEIAALLAEHQPVGLIAGLEPLTDIEIESSDRRFVVELPDDIVTLRSSDPDDALRWRLLVRDRLMSAFDEGSVIIGTDFAGNYVLEGHRL